MPRLDVQKAIQAAGVVLRREGKQASRLRLLKLLYIADRRYLRETGNYILGSRTVAMKHGPLHSEVLDLITGEHIGEPQWSHFFRNVGRDVRLQKEPGVDRLSRHEIELLTKIVDELVALQDWDVADLTHSFGEWIKNYPDHTKNISVEIPLADVIDAVGRSADKEGIIQDIKESGAFDSLFSGIAK